MFTPFLSQDCRGEEVNMSNSNNPNDSKIGLGDIPTWIQAIATVCGVLLTGLGIFLGSALTNSANQQKIQTLEDENKFLKTQITQINSNSQTGDGNIQNIEGSVSVQEIQESTPEFVLSQISMIEPTEVKQIELITNPLDIVEGAVCVWEANPSQILELIISQENSCQSVEVNFPKPFYYPGSTNSPGSEDVNISVKIFKEDQLIGKSTTLVPVLNMYLSLQIRGDASPLALGKSSQFEVVVGNGLELPSNLICRWDDFYRPFKITPLAQSSCKIKILQDDDITYDWGDLSEISLDVEIVDDYGNWFGSQSRTISF